jgi:GT2 family glycosyltransferase
VDIEREEKFPLAVRLEKHLNAPRLSIVVPVHNKSTTLEQFISAVAAQQSIGCAEVIFVDDRSTDRSSAILKEINQEPWAKVVRSSESLGSAARARNIGLRLARSEYWLLLDPDVILPKDLFIRVIHELTRNPTVVCLLEVLGNGASLQNWPLMVGDHSMLDSESLYTWSQTQDCLRDLRRAFVSGSDGNFNKLSAPWVFCWSAGMALTRKAGLTAGLFCDQFDSKGSEDLEFGYRLHKAGYRFRLLKGIPLLHLPHYRNRNREEDMDRRHERLMLQMHPTREVEALSAFDGAHANAMLSILKRITASVISRLEGPHSTSIDISRLSLPHTLDLVIGPAPKWLQTHFDVRRVIAPFQKRALDLFGFALPYEDASVECVAIVGLWQILPERLACRIFDEALRVGRTVFVIKHYSSQLPRLRWPEQQLAIHDAPYWSRTHRVRRSYFDFEVTPIGQSDGVSCYHLAAQR